MLNDTLTIGLILVLLFGSIALYLYTCIQQSEQKVSLLESILLDLKMSAEIKSYTEVPIEQPSAQSGGAVEASNNTEEYVPFEDQTENEENKDASLNETEENVPASSEVSADEVIDIDEYKGVIADAVEEQTTNPNYELMSLKELQALAKTRNIVGVTKKGPLIEALKTSDRSFTVKPSGMGAVGSNSFLETSASVSDESL